MCEKQFAFLAGISRVPYGKYNECKARIKEKLGIKTDPPFNRRMKGIVEPSVSQAKAIEEVFATYGIAAKDVWGA